MTRAKEELYLCHARLREFRGTTLYAVPSTFLNELPADGVEGIDLSASAAGTNRALDEWRSGPAAATEAWTDAGVSARPEPARAAVAGDGQGYAAGMLVRHEAYGMGRITEVSGFGALRRVKIRFNTAGEKTFVADKVKLEVVRRN
jgi:DNA helicase-2/ATP-dependent DNA helicase PcrA